MFKRGAAAGPTSQARPRDPLAPVEAITTILLSLFVGLALLGAVIAGVEVIRSGHTSVSFFEIGSDSTCVEASAGTANIDTYGSSGYGVRRAEGIMHFRAGAADYRTSAWAICLRNSTTAQYWAARIEPVGQGVFALGALLLLRRFIRSARRGGLFTAATSRTIRQLGWFLLVFTTLGPFAAAAGRGVIVSAAVRGAHWHTELWHPGLSLVLIVTALGVLTMARVLGRAVQLQEEVDATV